MRFCALGEGSCKGASLYIPHKRHAIWRAWCLQHVWSAQAAAGIPADARAGHLRAVLAGAAAPFSPRLLGRVSLHAPDCLLRCAVGYATHISTNTDTACEEDPGVSLAAELQQDRSQPDPSSSSEFSANLSAANPSLAAILGGVLGGLAALAAALVAAVALLRRQKWRRRRREPQAAAQQAQQDGSVNSVTPFAAAAMEPGAVLGAGQGVEGVDAEETPRRALAARRAASMELGDAPQGDGNEAASLSRQIAAALSLSKSRGLSQEQLPDGAMAAAPGNSAGPSPGASRAAAAPAGPATPPLARQGNGSTAERDSSLAAKNLVWRSKWVLRKLLLAYMALPAAGSSGPPAVLHAAPAVAR